MTDRRHPATVEMQRLLRNVGFRVAVDGRWGPQTQRAWEEYQRLRPLIPTEAAPDAVPDPKLPWHSRTLIGAAVVAVSQIVRIIWPEVDIDVSATVDAVTTLLSLVGAALAWWGRVKAARPIRWRRASEAVAGGPGADLDAERLRQLPANRYRPAASSGSGDPASGGDEFWSSHSGPFFGD